MPKAIIHWEETISRADKAIDALAEHYDYPDLIINPDFDNTKNPDPESNPLEIPNPESKDDFVQRRIVEEMTRIANGVLKHRHRRQVEQQMGEVDQL